MWGTESLCVKIPEKKTAMGKKNRREQRRTEFEVHQTEQRSSTVAELYDLDQESEWLNAVSTVDAKQMV